MDLQELRNPSISDMMLAQQGVTRVPFSSLNSTIRDMINVYAANVLPEHQRREILLKLYHCSPEKVSSTFMFIYGAENYRTFLQMISKEYIVELGTYVKTDCCKVMYTSQDKVNIDRCPVLTGKDKRLFETLEISAYGEELSAEHTHLLRVDTTSATIGGMINNITEYNLYIPSTLKHSKKG